LKVDIPAIPFARAWEAVLCGASDDSGRVVTYRTVLIEHFSDKGLRLVCSDGYLFLRAGSASILTMQRANLPCRSRRTKLCLSSTPITVVSAFSSTFGSS
jgi:hypothetical protein